MSVVITNPMNVVKELSADPTANSVPVSTKGGGVGGSGVDVGGGGGDGGNVSGRGGGWGLSNA